VWLVLAVILTALHFPYDTDADSRSSESSSASADSGRDSAKFYEVAYLDQKEERGMDYEATAKAAAQTYRIEEQVKHFVAAHDLAAKRVLEVGSGRGYLQDVVDDYTGLDISPSVAHYYHKRFIVGSATHMPFEADSFDAAWSVWVLEHIPTPEKALEEMRRVIKNNGLLWLYVAWNVPTWTADGFSVRPYTDFNWRGKIVKASLPVRRSTWFRVSYIIPTRAIRWGQYGLSGNDTHLHFRALDPNYETYWENDADAAISLDGFETYLWFRSRGDVCLNCGSPGKELGKLTNPLIIRIQKERQDRALRSKARSD
jgi:SAM-dependent methyltransferase